MITFLSKVLKKFSELKASLFQNLVTTLVCLSFVDAHLHEGTGFKLWSQSPEGMLLFLTVGVGMKMTKDVVTTAVTKRIGDNGSGNVDNPDKKES